MARTDLPGKIALLVLRAVSRVPRRVDRLSAVYGDGGNEESARACSRVTEKQTSCGFVSMLDSYHARFSKGAPRSSSTETPSPME